jgi:hypothetical protein
MLVIKNIADIKNKEFSYNGKGWILYGVDVNNIEYRFIFMPKDSIAMVYITTKAQLVLLNRAKHNRRGYRLWTTDGTHTYVNTNDIRNWTELVEMVFKNKMIC